MSIAIWYIRIPNLSITNLNHIIFGLFLFYPIVMNSQNNLALDSRIEVSSDTKDYPAKNIIDGNEETYWETYDHKNQQWATVVLSGATEIRRASILMEKTNGEPITKLQIQTFLNGKWNAVDSILNNQKKLVSIDLREDILTDRLRFLINDKAPFKIYEIGIFGQKYTDSSFTEVKKILVNQSGYNLDMPKRFTAPNLADGSKYKIISLDEEKPVFEGEIFNNIGDFSAFNPKSGTEFWIEIDTLSSYPFRIAPYWLERVTYQNMLDFMIGARHYVGSSKDIRSLSWAWRDGDFFNFAMQSLVSLYLSNPEVFKKMDKKVEYIPNKSLSEQYHDKWGKLDPYLENAPDIVKLIHWDADVKVTQKLDHEIQKAELAYFLYAFPYLKEWLPQQNFDLVYRYVKDNWEKDSVSITSTTKYDRSPEHNLLSLKATIGSTKGELPIGFSIIPNLLMYEVAKRENETDPERYFQAAYRQLDWIIKNVDWKDPLVTKGQRMSEHITMRAFAFFYNQYPEQTPPGLIQKVMDWSQVAVSRSNNIWDFRTYTENGDWVPPGWNETGNVLGFPACTISAMSVINDMDLKNRLEILTWSHIDNAFGRNPVGRHFSYDAPKEIEGVELGWYSYHKGGIGQLENVRFVFDGSPKTNHYPNHPEIGNLGWTEGWVQFNTAFNLSMAYLTNYYTDINLYQISKTTFGIRLKAPVNFYEDTIDTIQVTVKSTLGESINVVLKEEGQYSKFLIGTFSIDENNLSNQDNILKAKSGELITVSYGLGFFRKSSSINVH